MRAPRIRSIHVRGAALLALTLLFVPIISATAFPVQGGQADLAAIRNATAQYHDVNAAIADGYGPFYICTDKEGTGAMGQHYVNGALVDPDHHPGIESLHPEGL